MSLEAIRGFVAASESLRFEGENREQVYGWMEQVLCQQEYPRQGKAARGLLRRYLEKMTGLGRAQIGRLIVRYVATGRVLWCESNAWERTAGRSSTSSKSPALDPKIFP